MMKVEILIKKERLEKGISIDELSRLSGVSKGHLSRLERGERVPSITTLCKIAIGLNIKPEKLYNLIK